MELIKLKINLLFLLVLAILLNFYSCKYSFTGASVPAHIKTVAIPLLDDRSASGILRLKEDFTSVLTQKFVEDNTLQVSDRKSANSIIEGVILSAVNATSQISSQAGRQETASANKFTINVKIVFRDLINKKVLFEKTFTKSIDYSLTGAVESNRNAAIKEAIRLISDDIVLGVVSNW